MKTRFHKPNRSRQALTLIELIVVLTILVGLAGILVPTLTNMVARTSRSTSAVNISEVAGAVQRFEAIYLRYPNNLDSLMEDITTGGDTLGTLFTSLASMIEDVTLDANTLSTLNTAGITAVGVHGDDTGTYAWPTLTTLANTNLLKGLTATAQQNLGLETTGVSGKYIVLGIGTRSELTGTVMVDAPVHFPANASSNPQVVYSRFLVIMQITDGTNALTRARFIGALAPDGSSMGVELSGYFDTTNNE